MQTDSTTALAVQQTPLANLTQSKRDQAVALAKQGFRVFPLQINGKTPVHPNNWRKSATADPDKIVRMWTNWMDSEVDYNIGIALDADMLVVDVDVRDAKQGMESLKRLHQSYGGLPDTRVHKTASGGLHLLFRTRHRVSNSTSKVGQHIDIKTLGGFVVAPGSEIDGKQYTILLNQEIQDAPEWLTTLAGKPRARPESVLSANVNP